MQTNENALMQALAAPFDPREVKFKPAVLSGRRALALAYVDPRLIQDRLNMVLGAAGWRDEYEALPDGSIVCRLRLRLGDAWITKMDFGSLPGHPNEVDSRKAACGEALRRAAVKFGIGRYLYRLAAPWLDYDPQKRTFARPPNLLDLASSKPVKLRKTAAARISPKSKCKIPSSRRRKEVA